MAAKNICAAFALLFGSVTDYFLYQHFKPRLYPCTAILSVLAYLLLLKAFDNPFLIAKGYIFAQSLIVIGYWDAKTHEIPDMLLLPVLLTGFICFQPAAAIGGFFCVSLVFLITAKITGGIGGGDVKLIAACGFVLGAANVAIGTVLGLSLFILVWLLPFYRKKNQAFALAPFLGIGCFAACLF